MNLVQVSPRVACKISGFQLVVRQGVGDAVFELELEGVELMATGIANALRLRDPEVLRKQSTLI